MDRIEQRYQTRDCADWITRNEYRKVVLQFSEMEMPDLVAVIKSLRDLIPDVEFYTVVTASCSVDYLAPLRLGEKFIQAIVCFGCGASKTNLCLPSSATAFDQLPVLFVFGSEQTCNFDATISDSDLILYDLKCLPFISSFAARNNVRRDQIGKVIRSNEKWSFTRSTDPFIINKSDCPHTFGQFSISEPIESYDKIIWIGHCDDLFYQVNLARDEVSLISPSSSVPEMTIIKPRTNLSRRLALIEKAKLASTIGLVFNNSIPNVDSILKRVKKLSMKRGKKLCYLSLVQEADNTKFGNFPLIDVYVIISSCTCGSLAKNIKAHAPLITLTEYEISLGLRTFYGGVEWNKEVIEEVSEDEQHSDSHAASKQIMEYKQLMGNSWYGLQVDAGHDPVFEVEEGSRGVASSYEHEIQ